MMSQFLSILTEISCRPMAVYTGSPFIGPVLGPLLAGFINQVDMRA